MVDNREALVLEYCETKSTGVRDQIVEAYMPLVEYIARRLAFNRYDLDDLKQVGVIGLMRSLDRFDPSKKIDFSTFVSPNIIGEIKHYFRDKGRVVKIPRRYQEVYSKINAYIKTCSQEGFSPTVYQIANYIGESEDTVLEAMEAHQSSAVVSLDTPGNTQSHKNSGTDKAPSLVETISDEHSDSSVVNRIALHDALKNLNEREQKIIQMRFYTGLTQNEIAARMGLSQMHISRLIAGSLKKLKKVMEK